ncbi:MAG TPA: type I methionyl aminopeptidase [Planctomycetota bacterium]|nr:type I methionyl aminopeptidase [Planctomycetota bacterium]
MIHLKTPGELALMREAGKIVGEVLAVLREESKPGVTTQELDTIAEGIIRGHDAIPAFKGYGAARNRPAFPATICASVNDEVVHGVPGPRVLKDGDILSIDVGVSRKGWFADAAVTVPVGRISPEAGRLIRVCRESLEQAVRAVTPGTRLVDVARAVQQHAEANGCSVVREFVGHGIGSQMHEEPTIPNYVFPKYPDVELKPGMTLAIEPMVNQGGHEVRVKANGWTVVTRDRKLSAHFEHTVAVAREGAEVLTLPWPLHEKR